MRNKVDYVLIKDFIKRKNFLKKEFKRVIYKSVLRNLQTNDLVRIEVLKKMNFFKKKCSISRQNNVCLVTGRIGGVFKKWNLSRHSIKNVAKLTMLHNTKASSF